MAKQKASLIKKTPTADLLKTGAGGGDARVSKSAVSLGVKLTTEMLKDLADAAKEHMLVARRSKVTVRDLKMACKRVASCRGIDLAEVQARASRGGRHRIAVASAVDVFKRQLGRKDHQVASDAKPFLAEMAAVYLLKLGKKAFEFTRAGGDKSKTHRKTISGGDVASAATCY